MNILKFKNSVFVLTVFLGIAFLISSCEKETIVNDENTSEINLDEQTQNRYVFKGLKPVDASTTALPETNREDVTYFEMDKEAITEALDIQPKLMTFKIPTASKVFELELDKWDILTDDFQLIDGDDQIIPYEMNGIFYHGIVKDESNTVVAVSIFENQLNVMIMSENGTQVVKEEEDLIAFYPLSSEDLTSPHKLACDHSNVSSSVVQDDRLDRLDRFDARDIANQRSNAPIRMLYTLDYSLHQYFGGSWIAALNYLYARFNETKAIYANWNIPVQIASTRCLFYFNRLQSNTPNNILGGLFDNYRDRYSAPANYWDVTAAVTAVNNQGGYSSPFNYGGGIANVDDSAGACGGTAPICKRGAGTNVGPGCRPVQIINLGERNGSSDDPYFTYVMGHELGHNFGINQDYNNLSGGIMDHAAGNQLHIAHMEYVDMYTSWVPCY